MTVGIGHVGRSLGSIRQALTRVNSVTHETVWYTHVMEYNNAVKYAEWTKDLLNDLTTSESRALYLQSCLAVDIKTFCLGMKHVADSTGGVAKLQRETGIHRRRLYRIVAGEGIPTLRELIGMLGKMGLDIAITAGPAASVVRNSEQALGSNTATL